MTTLVLRLAGPMQAWGAASRFTYRATLDHPTKSGVVGLLAAAMGRRRTDPLEDLLDLSFGVRLDQPGSLCRDFQTSHRANGVALPLSHRFYLADAVFVAAVEGPSPLIETMHDAVRRPQFPLYLGRRACPPTFPLDLGIRDSGVRPTLEREPWAASRHHRRNNPAEVGLDVVADARPDDMTLAGMSEFSLRDSPLSFDPVRRDYATRSVVRYRVTIDNPDARREAALPTGGGLNGHDPMDALEG